MKLPLSQTDKEEISEAYQKAATAIEASAASLKELVEVLEQKMACLDPTSRKALGRPFDLIGSSLFRFGVLRLKVQNANLDGREFSAFPDATCPEP